MINQIRSFFKSDQGGIAIIVAYSLLPIILLVGLGTDLSRINMAQTTLKAAADAASLAAARNAAVAVTTTGQKVFNANFPSGYLGMSTPQVTTTLGSDNVTITIAVTSTLPAILGKLAGINTYTISTVTKTVRTYGSLEVSLALDNTGSMAGSRLSTLKTATQSFLDILFQGASTQSPVTVSIVPFTDVVNIGPSRTNFLKNPSDATFTSLLFLLYGPWDGCILERTAPLDQNDTPPSSTNLKFGVYNYNPNLSQGRSFDPNTYCPISLMPLSNDITALKSKLNQMTASGPTAINTGLVWGWRTLSSNWIGYWSGGIDPKPAGTANNRKVVVLLTDGENALTTYSTYGHIGQGNLGTTNLNAANVEINKRTITTCQNIKNAGIELYVIGLLVTDAATKTLLKNCASNPDNSFFATSTSDLVPFFTRIAYTLRAPRVTQ